MYHVVAYISGLVNGYSSDLRVIDFAYNFRKKKTSENMLLIVYYRFIFLHMVWRIIYLCGTMHAEDTY